ncbi:sensor histidine kinase [Corynebacterium aquatimens]|uniref:Sensor-like histidine kinase SenX3 n=1 Tax=Corynebacterium aquatimens TaxID=1190508 RepID=A0A931E201_9CORY|nr:ATP-binding protein [Corynebacterium aquatimens]MBG6122467.1 two-component system sensor histidine kinase SenX3 [Corynebacterium aquatimens]WJY64993.1 Signal-transduction histidine kinase senX3 [Corynebacterium aquatimens]
MASLSWWHPKRYLGTHENRRAEEDDDAQARTVGYILNLVIQSSPTGVAVIGRGGDVVLSNARAHDMSIVHDRTLNPEVRAVAEGVFAEKESQSIDLTLRRRSTGSRITNVRAVVTPLSLPDGDFVAVYATDESENARMESARRDFVANVSHELKTPVGGMSLLAEALLEDPEDPGVVRYFGEKLLKESHRMGGMISDLISLSKLQGAEALPEMAPVRVDDIIDEAMLRNQVAADNQNIELTRGETSDTYVMGDRSLLVTALSNLVTNAINYSAEGQPVSVTQKVVRDSVVLIRVTDRGIGIAPENQKRVFERFFRVDKARSRSTGGTGLGLAIVKHVVANHGGNIKLWSRLGTGSTFTIELPVYAANMSAPPVVPPALADIPEVSDISGVKADAKPEVNTDNKTDLRLTSESRKPDSLSKPARKDTQ